MDSDSSLDEERNRWNKQDVPVQPNINDDNSDVSDEENISRAARSIESPPESPQGTNFESPPASPNPGNKPETPSPIHSQEDSASYESPLRSPDSQMESSQLKNPNSPKSPDSFPQNSFADSFNNYSPQSNRNKPPSPAQTPEPPHSPRSQSTIKSPRDERGHSPSQRSDSPSSIRSHSSYRQSCRRGSESPDSESPHKSSPRFKGRRSPSQSPTRLPSSRLSDDGRSNISSGSSFGSPSNSPPRARTPPEPSSLRVKTAAELKSHVEDLSDVSDVDSLNSMSDDESEITQKKEKELNGTTTSETKKDLSSFRKATSLEADEAEQLDFEAEEKEEGECDGPQPAPKPTANSAKVAAASDDDGELKGDELEEGEITDEGENRPEETEPRPICRFYNRGQCTWGSSCRFVHPGVTDKGNYTMFEMVRPLVPMNGPPMPMPMYGPPPPPMDPYRPPIERPPPMMGPPMYQPQPPPIVRKEEPPPTAVESAWERGLRQAKEMIRKSSKRKETEVDFEEKKMNLSIGQDDLDKENDYYTRAASPTLVEDGDRWGGKMEGSEPKRYRSDRYNEYSEGGGYYSRSTEQVWHQRPHYDESMRGVYSSRSSKYYSSSKDKEYYSSSGKKSKYSSHREVIVRPEKNSSWKDDTPPPTKPRSYEIRGKSVRGDEWADPWMRSKTSPLTRKRTRKQSYSSGSSYTSSSSSRSSHSSSSSYSRSRTGSHSSRSRSRDKLKVSPTRHVLRVKSPLTRTIIPEKKVPAGSIMMNPSPPSPRGKLKVMGTNPSPPFERMRPGAGSSVPARLLGSKAASAVAAAMRSARSRSKSSRSSSNSDSSGSSSDSSESSLSSSSSSRLASPPIRQKRIVIDDRLALAEVMKVKAMDALKLSGQKQQIKLTLKGTGIGDRMPLSLAGKKRPAESPPMSFSPPKMGGKTTPKKAAPSRREELLKQLKAVEDAIARKRSKIS